MSIAIDDPVVGSVTAPEGLDLPGPYLLFLGDAEDTTFLKTGLGLRDWAPGLCIGEHKCAGAAATLGLTLIATRVAYAAGARAPVWSAASLGGAFRETWIPHRVEAL